MIRLPHLLLEDLASDERIATPSRLAVHPSGSEVYVAGDAATLIVDPDGLDVVGLLGPANLTALEVAPSGRIAVAVDLTNTTAFLFDAKSHRTFTAPLSPDVDPSELLSVQVLISEAMSAVYVLDRPGDAVVVMPFV